MHMMDLDSGYPSTYLLAALAASRRSPERKKDAVISQKIEELNKQRRTHSMIRQSMCPICNGKLNRGKKDKHNNYKRKWSCMTCGSEYTI